MKTRTLSVYTSVNNPNYSRILLNGKWLHEAGFNQGDKVNVQIKSQKLIITVNPKTTNKRKKGI